jgi:hypothetical protein
VNILFAMESPEYLRFYDDTIRLLASRGHRVSVAVTKQRDKKPVRLEGALADDEHIVLLGIVPKRADLWRGIGKGLRGLTDFARYLHPRLAKATALRARMKRKALPSGFRWIDAVPSVGTGGSRALMRALAALERAIPSSGTIEQFIEDQHADLVLVSPLVDAASDQVDLVKSAQKIGVPVAACIASWDNLTNKGALRLVPDRVLVWNEAQRQEAIAYHDVPGDRVVITGAQLFDRWFERHPSSTRAEFCAAVRLPAGKPFILFTCSSSFISVSEKEVPFVRGWIEALRANPIVGDMPILIRPHPYNCAAWETADFSDLEDVAIWPGRAYNPIDEVNRNGFFDSLYHSAAVVGINTSAMIEAAILGKPVLSMLAGEFAGTQEGTLHFHHLLPENGGFLRVAGTLDAHVLQLAEVMAHPDDARAETERFVGAFIRPQGRDVPSTPVMADALETIARSGRRPGIGLPWWAAIAWPLLIAGGAYAAAWSLVTDPKALSKLRKELGSYRRRASKRLARAWRVTVDRAQRGTRRLLKQVR